ncbi:hypothetical protein POMI540_0821 [Schizosaccharomyces pombe]
MNAENTFSILNTNEPNAGGSQVTESEIEEEDIEFLSFTALKIGATSSLSNSSLGLPEYSNLFAINNLKSLFVAGVPNYLIIGSTLDLQKSLIDADENVDANVLKDSASIRHVSLPDAKFSMVSFSSNGEFVIAYDFVSFELSIYETDALLKNSATSIYKAVFPDLVQVLPNPEINDLVILRNLKLEVFLLSLSKLQVESPLAKDATCAAWSRRGKQCVIGFNNGTMSQYTPAGEIKLRIPRPPSLENYFVECISWIENREFVVFYSPLTSLSNESDEPPHESECFVISVGMNGHFNFGKAGDPTPPFGAVNRRDHHYIASLHAWKPDLRSLVVVANTASADLGVLALSMEKNQWSILNIVDETKRASLPYSNKKDSDSSPTALVMDFTATDRISKPLDPTEAPADCSPLPIVWVFNDEFQLVAYRIFYADAISKSIDYPEMNVIKDKNKDSTVRASNNENIPTPDKQASPFVKNLSSTSSPFSQPSAFGNFKFGQATSFDKGLSTDASSGAKSNTPVFGQPSTFGQAPVFGQPSAFGQAPVFGQPSAFGQPSFSFGTSNMNQKLDFGTFKSPLSGAATGEAKTNLEKAVTSASGKASFTGFAPSQSTTSGLNFDSIPKDNEAASIFGSSQVSTKNTSGFQFSNNTLLADNVDEDIESDHDTKIEELANSDVEPSTEQNIGGDVSWGASTFQSKPQPSFSFGLTLDDKSNTPGKNFSIFGKTAETQVEQKKPENNVLTKPFSFAPSDKSMFAANIPSAGEGLDQQKTSKALPSTGITKLSENDNEKAEESNETKGFNTTIAKQNDKSSKSEGKASVADMSALNKSTNNETSDSKPSLKSPLFNFSADASTFTFNKPSETPPFSFNKPLVEKESKQGVSDTSDRSPFSFKAFGIDSKKSPTPEPTEMAESNISEESEGWKLIEQPNVESEIEDQDEESSDLNGKRRSTPPKIHEVGVNKMLDVVPKEKRDLNSFFPKQPLVVQSTEKNKKEPQESLEDEILSAEGFSEVEAANKISRFEPLSSPKLKLATSDNAPEKYVFEESESSDLEEGPVPLRNLESLADLPEAESNEKLPMVNTFERLYLQFKNELDLVWQNINIIAEYIEGQTSTPSAVSEQATMAMLSQNTEELEDLLDTVTSFSAFCSDYSKQIDYLEACLVRINAKRIQVTRLLKALTNPAFEKQMELRQLGPEALRRQKELRLKMEKVLKSLSTLEQQAVDARMSDTRRFKKPTLGSIEVAYSRIATLLGQRLKQLYKLEKDIKRMTTKKKTITKKSMSSDMMTQFRALGISQSSTKQVSAHYLREFERQDAFRNGVFKRLTSLKKAD